VGVGGPDRPSPLVPEAGAAPLPLSAHAGGATAGTTKGGGGGTVPMRASWRASRWNLARARIRRLRTRIRSLDLPARARVGQPGWVVSPPRTGAGRGQGWRGTMRAIVVHETGGPETLRRAAVPVPEPGPRQARVPGQYAALNFIDVYHRPGLDVLAGPVTTGRVAPREGPFTPGSEAAGEVGAVGPGVSEFRPGDRVAYAMERGAYAEYAIVPAWKLVHVPEGIGLDTAAAVMLQGMTAHYLTHSTFP